MITKTKEGGGTEKHVREVSAALNKREEFNVEIAYTEDGFWTLYRRIYTNRYDVVHFFLPRPYLLGSLACDLAFQHNRIMSRRSLTDSYQKPWIRFVERILHKRTKILLGNSPAVVRQLRTEAPKSDIRLIRNGITIKPLKRYNPDNLFRILCVANNYEYKGLEDLRSAVRRIILPKPWHVFIAGRGTEDIEDWQTSGLGYCKHITELLASANLFVLPSHEEGSSNALLEAMACGVPVIATDVGGNTDAITHMKNGLLVPPRKPECLATAILWAFHNPIQCQAMAYWAKTDVAVRFSFERCVSDYEALYRSAA